MFLLHDIPQISLLIRGSNLKAFAPGEVLMQQGATDDEIHLIVAGSFDIEVNGRYWTTRHSLTHIGEAAMIDPTAKRNATAKAAEHSVVLSIAEKPFTKFANSNPNLWRRIAVELSKRLTERTRLTPIPRSEPVVFLGCSTEALDLAREIQATLSNDALVQIWTDGVFHPTKSPIEDLCEFARNVDFAAVLLTPDDKTKSRNKQKMSPRDNVLLELGLMMGAIGRDRTFFVVEKGIDLKMPSDLLGINPISYQPIKKTSEIQARLGPACTELRRVIKNLGPI